MIARITQIRRSAIANVEPPPEHSGPKQASMAALEARIAALEEMIEGLQDSVHRESTRQSKRIADLEARIEPSALAVALSQDARERGL